MDDAVVVGAKRENPETVVVEMPSCAAEPQEKLDVEYCSAETGIVIAGLPTSERLVPERPSDIAALPTFWMVVVCVADDPFAATRP